MTACFHHCFSRGVTVMVAMRDDTDRGWTRTTRGRRLANTKPQATRLKWPRHGRLWRRLGVGVSDSPSLSGVSRCSCRRSSWAHGGQSLRTLGRAVVSGQAKGLAGPTTMAKRVAPTAHGKGKAGEAPTKRRNTKAV